MIKLAPDAWKKISAQIVIEGTLKNKYKQGELEQFKKKLNFEGIVDPFEKLDAAMLLSCICTGRKVVAENGKVELFFSKELKGELEAECTISDNPKLYQLITELMV